MFKLKHEYQSINEVLMDQKLAKLGDAYVNFLYSLAVSKKDEKPTGIKVKGKLLADALKKAGLRNLLPSRTDRHKQADAAEALTVYAWALGAMTMEEGLEILEKTEDNVEAFCRLLQTAKLKIEEKQRKMK
jgi:hypothetical protein